MKYAWIENHAVRDICPGDPAELYHDEIAALYSTQIPDDTLQGATFDGKSWVNPVIVPLPEAVEVTPVVSLVCTPPQFKMLFTARERIVIAAARKDDPVLEDFYSLLDDPRLLQVDMNDSNMIDAREYMVMKDYITMERAEAIAAMKSPK